jgi:hypothetical protein
MAGKLFIPLLLVRPSAARNKPILLLSGVYEIFALIG